MFVKTYWGSKFRKYEKLNNFADINQIRKKRKKG